MYVSLTYIAPSAGNERERAPRRIGSHPGIELNRSVHCDMNAATRCLFEHERMQNKGLTPIRITVIMQPLALARWYGGAWA